MPHNEDFFKGFTILEDVPAFAVQQPETAFASSAQIEHFADYVVSRKEASDAAKSVSGPKAIVNSFVSRLREQREESARRPESGHYL
ncbi:MAG: hypothetical protein FJX23_10250 [Alphaproteobacteria bacterium]|nr:hypothetical protein [Alphaproteobacteria bacterium]